MEGGGYNRIRDNSFSSFIFYPIQLAGADPEEFMLTATLHVLESFFVIMSIIWIVEIGAGMDAASVGPTVGIF